MPFGDYRNGCRGRWQLAILLLTLGCAPAQVPTPALIGVHASSAAYPWLGAVYACAPAAAAVKLTDDEAAGLSIRLGEPKTLNTPAYEIGIEELLVVVHPQTGVSHLSLDQARSLFSGQVTNWKDAGGVESPVQVWTFSPAVDVQDFFDAIVMNDRPITSFARLAVSAQFMSDSVGSVPGSIGILPRRWKTGNTTEALLLSSLPVLAVVREQPEGDLAELISCLQSGK